MQTEFKQIDATTKEIILTVEPERVDAAYQKYLQKAAKQLEVPGFRKGKAPLNMVTRLYSEKIQEHFEQDFVDEAFTEAAKEHDIHFLLYPEVKDLDWQPGSEMEITFEIEHEPAVEFSQLENLQVPSLAHELDKEVDKFILNLAKEHTTVQDVEVADGGDMLEGHFSFDNNGQPYTRQTAVYAGDEEVADFPERMIGAKTGDKFEAKLKGSQIKKIVPFDPELDPEAEQVFACSFEVSSISRNNIPDVDDEFAKDMDFADMAEMRAKIADDLRPRVEHANYDGENSAILGKLYQDNQFPLPSKTLRYIVGQELNNIDEKLREVLQQYVVQRAIQDMINMYLLGALQKQSGLELTDEMIDSYVEHQAVLKDMNPAAYREENSEDIAEENFRDAALNYQILRGIAASSVFVEPEPEPEYTVIEDSEETPDQEEKA